MYRPTRYATKITAASISLIAVTFVFCLTVDSQTQEPDRDKLAAAGQDKPGQDKPTAPSQDPAPEKKKLGTELDDRSLITNTDLITLTVTVTDTYGRYVSGLSKNAFTVFDNKQQQEITFFSDED